MHHPEKGACTEWPLFVFFQKNTKTGAFLQIHAGGWLIRVDLMIDHATQNSIRFE